MKSSKCELRKDFLMRRNNFSNKNDADKLIFSSLTNAIKKYNDIFTYISYGSEVDTIGFIKYLFESGKNVYVPKCDIDKCEMTPVKITSFDNLKENKYGILEPVNNDVCNNKIDAIIFPGLVFDINGNRIGYGKGYYDRFFASLNYCPPKIAVCYDFQILDSIPTNSNDVKMDMIITENRTVII